ncbi:CHAT domain-containing protein [Streptomyces sp. SID5785]|uniref:CHAT domain-containing protein n=1 Tax=Streptomyces sp. SID5785 TaxID=2690309 RepID=UPI001360F372|nr:CHAT domain-containing protein [Streptomyces sp. SID5785]MZD05945.1 CHAT domain-containing protein [Streptomyces sp. SID5785]
MMTTLQVRVSEPRPGRTQYAYELRSGNGALVGPLEQEHTVPVSQDLVKGLCKEIDERVKDAAPADEGALREALVRLGGQLHDALFPQTGDLVRQLRQTAGPLLVQSNETLVPWELLHDEEDFLGLRHDMGRRAKVDGPVVDGRSSERIRRALVVGDTLGDLAPARKETELISAWLTEQGVECTVLTGADATLVRVVGELADKAAPYDLFHYSGHVSAERGAAGLLVHDRKCIDLDALRPLARRGAPPIVLINGCASASPTLDAPSRALAEAAQTMNACMSFMVMGAKTVVGTRTPVRDASALRFAEAFYGELGEQAEAGVAVRGARAALAGDGDGTWASFVLYGDPSVRITAAPAPAPQPERTARPRYTTQAFGLLRRAGEFGEPRGIITSVDLLTALLETDEVRERATVRLGSRLLRQLTEMLQYVQSHTPAGGGDLDDTTDTADSTGSADSTQGIVRSSPSVRTDGASVNGTSVQTGDRRIAFSDTIARVVEGADAAVMADGRDRVGVDDIAVAFLETGGGNCADLLKLIGIRPELLLAPVVESAARSADDGQPLALGSLGPGAAAAVRTARLLAAAKEKRISTSLLLQAFAVAGSDVLREALAGQGEDGARAYRSLGRLGRPRRHEFYSRTRDKLERLAAGAEDAGRLVDEESVLLELLADEDSSARRMLVELGVEPDELARALRATSPDP